MVNVTHSNNHANDNTTNPALRELRAIHDELAELRQLIDAGIRAFLAAKFPHGIPDDDFAPRRHWRGR